MNHKFSKRVISLLLGLIMVIGLFPAAALAVSDSTPPVLKNVTLSSTTVTAPGQVEITVEATDDISGANYANVYFHCEETGKGYGTAVRATYWDSNRGKEVAYADGKLHGTLELGEYTPAGTYLLDAVELEDAAGNWCVYLRDAEGAGSGYNTLPAAVKKVQFTVVNSNADSTPPVLKGVSLSATTVTAPGQVEITVEATDDISGANYANVHFWCEETEKGYGTAVRATYWDSNKGKEVAYADGKLHGTLELGEYTPAGTYLLDAVELEDAAGNWYSYFRGAEKTEKEYGPLPAAVKNVRLVVINGDAEGWIQENGGWVYYQNGTKLVSKWLNDGGKWYYLDSDGFMATGWQLIDGKWYYLDSYMKTGWQQIGGKWYYLKSEMKTGWQQIDGKWYYLDSYMKTGWQLIDGKWYYLDSYMKTGWQKIDGQWYYLNSYMKTGWQKIDGSWYYLNSYMKTGWQKIGGSWYYLGSNGIMRTGWQYVGSSWYYLGTNGIMVTGTHVIDGVTYTFDSNGAMIK